MHANQGLQLTIEILISLISPMPFFMDLTYEEDNDNYDIKVDHRYNDVLLFLMFIKIYIPFRFLLMASYYQSNRAQRV